MFLSCIKYLSQARNWRGHGIHSPFVFDLVHNVMLSENPYYAFVHLQKTADRQNNAQRKQRELLFRILNNTPAAQYLLVFGGSAADAMYLAAVNTSAVCIFVSKKEEEDFFLKKDFTNICVVKTLQEVFLYCPTLDFVFFGKVEKKDIAECLQHINEKTIFAFADTFAHNAENWAFIASHKKTQLTIRTFRLGLVYFNREIQKGDYTLLY